MKLIKYLFVALVLGAFSSCSDYLDKQPDDMLTLEMVFNDKTRTEDWLAGCYSSIPDPLWSGAYGLGQNGLGPLGDDVAPSTGWEKFGWNIVAKQTGNWSPNSGDGHGYWSLLPKRIRTALIFIENVKPNAAQLVTEADVENMKNEARFLIAYYKTLLVDPLAELI